MSFYIFRDNDFFVAGKTATEAVQNGIERINTYHSVYTPYKDMSINNIAKLIIEAQSNNLSNEDGSAFELLKIPIPMPENCNNQTLNELYIEYHSGIEPKQA